MSANMLELSSFGIDGVKQLNTFSQLPDNTLASIMTIRFKNFANCLNKLTTNITLREQFCNALSRSQVTQIDLSGTSCALYDCDFQTLQNVLSHCKTLTYIEGFNEFTRKHQTALITILDANIEAIVSIKNTVTQMLSSIIPSSLTTIIADYIHQTGSTILQRNIIKIVYTICDFSTASAFSNLDGSSLQDLDEITFSGEQTWFTCLSPDDGCTVSNDNAAFFRALSTCAAHTVNICNLRLKPSGEIPKLFGSLSDLKNLVTINLSEIHIDDTQFEQLRGCLRGCKLTTIGGIDQFTPERQQMLMAILPSGNQANTHNLATESKVCADHQVNHELIFSTTLSRAVDQAAQVLAHRSAEQQGQETGQKKPSTNTPGEERPAANPTTTHNTSRRRSCAIS